MKVRFKVNYFTQWGQRLYIVGSVAKMGKSDVNKAIPMEALPNGNWEAEVDLKGSRVKQLEYRYVLKDEYSGNVVAEEHGEDRTLDINKEFDLIKVEDSWRSTGELSNVFTSSAFSRAIFGGKRTSTKQKKISLSKTQKEMVYRFEVMVPRIVEGYEVRVVGNIPALGNWDLAKGVKMSCEEGSLTWYASLKLKVQHAHLKYKFVIVNSKTGEVANYEQGEDRYLYVEAAGEDHVMQVVSGGYFRYEAAPWKGVGVALPVFSLRTHQGLGVGEFLDIKLLVDWAKHTGMRLVQILPVNDTIATHTWVDSYPYAAISVYALHPIYINLEQTGKLKSKKRMTELSKKKKELNALESVDYDAVMDFKMAYLQELWEEKKASFYKDAKAKEFLKEHEGWLKPYAVFSYQRELYGTPDFTQWKSMKKYTKTGVDKLFSDKETKDKINFYVFVQYHLHLQLLEAAEYARANQVVLKGDIPIGIYRHSADAWSEPRLYNMDGQAGAPPDDFAVNGQNWGFPTYNWEEMRKDGYQWWVSRMTHLSQYFDAFRIDHILGFFRIWEIPLDSVQGLLGQFRPAIPLHVDEFRNRGMHFDRDRLCKPYIREHFLGELFGENTAEVKDTFLNEYAPGCFEFKDKFDSQRKIQDYFAKKQPKSEDEQAKNDAIRDALYHLHNEVILIPALGYEDGMHYVPRVTADKSRTFRELGEFDRHIIWELYIDYFFHRQEGLWAEQAMEKLPAITNATDMLICGEDLGMVPACVPGVMDALNILSLEIQRMPKDIEKEFAHPNDYPYMSVGSPSTHDMSTVRGWWEENQEETQRFYNHMMGHWGGAPFFCDPWVAEEIFNMHLYSPSMWAIFPLQDIMAIDGELRRESAEDERINIPAIKHHYWKYRFHINLEDLMKENGFNDRLRDMITKAGRNTPF
ncbi:4-alpha-glucanotransferase [Algivirga pacifica]|uniref:4-alpha-glucanotransferase n=1 Tax=Algivirga pacifica TaxID=1162670 RepID=A0ABP9CZC2_9BACT